MDSKTGEPKMNFLKRIVFVFKYSDEIETILEEKRKEERERKFEESRYHLKLCKKHQQEQNRSHFAEHNCDYCNLEKQVNQK